MLKTSDYMKRFADFTKNSPKFRSLMSEIIDKFLVYNEKANQLAFNSDVYSTYGIFLDRIGEIVGLPREDVVLDDPDIVLSDVLYRLTLLGRMFKNSTDCTIGDIEEKVNTIFGDLMTLTILDNQDMTATYQIEILEIGEDTAFLSELAGKGYFTPKPSGVFINYDISIRTETPLVYDTGEDNGKYDITHYDGHNE